MQQRKLPLGIQDFEEMRRDGYLYVDKTDMVWQMANGNKYNYFSRPRRFGKSLLCSTLKCYFEGRRDLFEGLKIMQIEKEWVKRPIIYLSMSLGGSTGQSLCQYLDLALSSYEKIYDREVKKAMFDMVLPIMLNKETSQGSTDIQSLKMAMIAGDVDQAMLCLKQLIACTPYSTQKKEKFVFEEHFRFIIKHLFYICGFVAHEEVEMASGRIDITVEIPNIIYVLELKMDDNGGVDAAADQVTDSHYADLFATSKKQVKCLALEFSKKSRGLKGWKGTL